MNLSIISPEQKNNYKVAWIEVQTEVGSFVLQPGHAPMVLVLASNKPLLFRLESGKEKSINIANGVIEVGRASAIVLINTAL